MRARANIVAPYSKIYVRINEKENKFLIFQRKQAKNSDVWRILTAHAPHFELAVARSERELEVLQLIAEGLTNREIASRLYLSLNTVKGHARNIYGKLSVHSRTQAVARARAFGILPPT